MWHNMWYDGMWIGWIFWIIIIFLIVFLVVRYAGAPRGYSDNIRPRETARDILDRKYANDEITEEEYRRKRKNLES